MAHTAPWMDPCQMPDATYQPQHSEGPHSSPMTFDSALVFQDPNSDYSAQNLPAANSVGSWEAASVPNSDAIGGAIDHSEYPGAIVEHAHPGGDGEVAMEVQSNERDAVPYPTRTEGKKRINWRIEETLVLLECKEAWFKDKGSRYRNPQRNDATNWNAIAEAVRAGVRDTCGASEKTVDQCRLRWDTLVKSHRRIKERYVESGKGFAEVMAEDPRSLKLPTTLKPEWYEVIDRVSGKARSRKQSNPGARKSKNGGGGDGPVSTGMARAEAGLHALVLEGGPALGAGSIPAAPGCPGMSKPKALQRFLSLDRPPLRSILLDLFHRLRPAEIFDIDDTKSLSLTCEWLSAVQRRSPKDIYDDVSILVQMGLLHVYRDGDDGEDGEDSEEGVGGEEGVGVYVELEWSLFFELENYVEELMRKNSFLDTHTRLEFSDLEKLPSARESLAPHDRIIRVLTLYNCYVLESIDLESLPKLRSLIVLNCPVLKEITGWEHLGELGWLEISGCSAYASYPDLRHFPSLRVCSLVRGLWLDTVDPVGHKFDISKCERLRILEIFHDKALKESGDLSSLKCLEELTFHCCSALSTVVGLSELHSLTRLVLHGCKALRSLPDIGHMIELVHIDIGDTIVEEIPGIEKLVSLKTLYCYGSKLSTVDGLSGLHSLTRLVLGGCEALRSLPDIGHMIELVHIDISYTSVEEIPGIEKLVSLKTLHCGCSELKQLPDLHHLPELQKIVLWGTPLKLKNGTCYFGKEEVVYNREEKIEEVSYMKS